MGTTFEQLRKKMEAAGDNGTSKLNLRNEKLQKKSRVSYIPKLKREAGKVSKLCVVREIAIPFNPMTGEVDETYNEDRKWRPTFSVNSTIKLLKGFASENEKVAEVFRKESGKTDWKIGEVDSVTNEDMEVFKKFLVPRILTIPTVEVNISSLCRGDYATKYRVNVDTDPITGECIGEVPLILQASKFFNDLANEAILDYNEKVKNGELKHDEKTQKEERSKIRSRYNLVGRLQPYNLTLLFELPTNKKGAVEDTAFTDGCKNLPVSDYFRWSNFTQRLEQAFNKFDDTIDGSYGGFDWYNSFFVLNMKCPVGVESPMDVGRGTEYTNELSNSTNPKTGKVETGNSIYETDWHAKFEEKVDEYLDSIEGLEERVLASSYVVNYDESIAEKLVEALRTRIDQNDPHFTQRVIKRNKDFLSIVLGDAIDQELAEIECGISERKEGILDEAKSFDIVSQLEEMDVVSTDTVEI